MKGEPTPSLLGCPTLGTRDPSAPPQTPSGFRRSLLKSGPENGLTHLPPRSAPGTLPLLHSPDHAMAPLEAARGQVPSQNADGLL